LVKSIKIAYNKSKANRSENDDHFEWFQLSIPSLNSKEFVKARFYSGPFDLKDLMGFNNTGNICINS